MVDDIEAIPPPYSPYDPLTSLHPTGGEIVHPTQTHTPPVHGDNRGISSNGYVIEEDKASQTSPVKYAEEHLAPQRQLQHGLTSHTVYPFVNSSSKATNHGDLSTLSESVADMKLCSPSATTSELKDKHPTAGISLQDIKANILIRLTSSTPPSHSFSKPERGALKSDLRAFKHEIRAVAHRVKSEQREARAKDGGGRCCKASSRQEKWELRRWKRESLKELRVVKRVVRAAGRECP
jgi:hypothetical protein